MDTSSQRLNKHKHSCIQHAPRPEPPQASWPLPTGRPQPVGAYDDVHHNTQCTCVAEHAWRLQQDACSRYTFFSQLAGLACSQTTHRQCSVEVTRRAARNDASQSTPACSPTPQGGLASSPSHSLCGGNAFECERIHRSPTQCAKQVGLQASSRVASSRPVLLASEWQMSLLAIEPGFSSRWSIQHLIWNSLSKCHPSAISHSVLYEGTVARPTRVSLHSTELVVLDGALAW